MWPRGCCVMEETTTCAPSSLTSWEAAWNVLESDLYGRIIGARDICAYTATPYCTRAVQRVLTPLYCWVAHMWVFGKVLVWPVPVVSVDPGVESKQWALQVRALQIHDLWRAMFMLRECWHLVLSTSQTFPLSILFQLIESWAHEYQSVRKE